MRSGVILNCPITIEDVNIYFEIFKMNILGLKGNINRTKPDMQAAEIIKIPVWILETNTILNLYIDVFLFVD